MLAAITLGMFVPRVNSKVQTTLSRISEQSDVGSIIRFIDSVT